jgi:hypothetical protein
MVFIDLKVDFEYTMMQENAMYFDEVQDATVCLKNKIFCWHHFLVLYNLFSRLMVFLACDKMSQEIFCNHWRADCVDAKEFERGT